MTAQIIDGTAIAARLREEVAADVVKMVEAGLPKPGLATVLVGDNPASQTYVRSKGKACEKAGMTSYGYTLPADATQAQVEGLVKELNADPKVNGILVQLPLPVGPGRGAGARCHQHREGCGWFPPAEHWPAGAERP